jgi:alginate O-acetyltransferase complex protein AlgJ
MSTRVPSIHLPRVAALLLFEARRSVSLAVDDLASAKTFPGRLRLYLQRTFGLRGALVRGHGLLKVRGLGVSSSPNVLLGKQGWLYLASEHSLDGYRRLWPLSPERLAGHRAVLAERKAWLATRGVEYVFFCAPNKETIYPQFMPDDVRQGRGPSWLDQLHAAAPGLVLDVRPALRAAARSQRVYHLTDTHWNELGGLRAAQAVEQELRRRQPGLPSFDFERVTYAPIEVPGGDLSRLLGLKFDDREQAFELRFPDGDVFTDDGAPLAIEHVDVQNMRLVRVRNPNGRLGKAVVFRDSFGELLKQPLAQLFRETVFVWTDYFDPRLVEAENPEFVIQELVERRLATHEPRDLAASRAVVATKR